jgi:hypothetical protein
MIFQGINPPVYLRVVTVCCMAGTLAMACGCGKTHDAAITGLVRLDGKPVTQGCGLVAFRPVGSGPMAYGNIQSDGTYRIVTGGSKGLPSGEYIVTVSVSDVSSPDGREGGFGKQLIPLRYGNPEQSGLKFTVQPGSNRFDISLRSLVDPKPD